jgi:predicted RNase H-like nuclease (RuvC/YqgF family)
MQRGEKNVKLARQENVYLKSLLDSCDVSIPDDAGFAGIVQGGDYTERIGQLEALLTQYRSRITEYEDEIKVLQTTPSVNMIKRNEIPVESSRQRNADLTKKIQDFSVENDLLKRSITALEYEIQMAKAATKTVSIRVCAFA